MTIRRIPLRLALLLFAMAAASACARGLAPGPLVVRAVGDTPATRHVEVTGLSGTELRALAAAAPAEDAWQYVLRVSLASRDDIPIAGRYVVTDRALEFHPRFPFDGGRDYSARFDPMRLPQPRQEPAAAANIRFAAPERTPSTAVTAIYPSAGLWPENMLRFYIHFSAPMSRGHRTDFVHLLDERGEEIPDAILAAYSDLWNPEGTRLTVFFDPGRVKRGVGPNVSMGRAIVTGKRYAIAVDPAWPDAVGQPLISAFRHEFTAGPAAYRALVVDDWRVTAPISGSRDPLTITFPAPLDRALLERTIGVRSGDDVDVAGRAAVAAGETQWSFVPDITWPSGPLQIVVLRSIEDPAGNRIGRAFEVLAKPGDPVAPKDTELVRIPFALRAK